MDEPADEPADEPMDEPADSAMADESMEPVKIGMIAQVEELMAFPEVPAVAQAYVDYFNAELGGVDGHPIELVVCGVDVASRRLTLGGAVRDYFRPRKREERVEEVLDLLDMGDIAERQPRELSQGQRKLVGVGRALVAESTRILLLDEPAAGLDKAETEWFGAQLRRLVDQGYTMLLVDHDMGLVLNVCDYIHMLVFGELTASGTPDEMSNNPEVIAAYLGHSGGEA